MTPTERDLIAANKRIAELEAKVEELEARLPKKKEGNWNDKLDQRLKNIIGEGHTGKAAASMLRKDKGQVYRRMKQLGLKPQTRRAWTEAECEAIKKGIESDLTSGQIAVKLPGRTGPQVNTQAYRMGLKFTDKRHYNKGKNLLP